MRKFKKLAAILVATSMVCAFAATASAGDATDTATATATETATDTATATASGSDAKQCATVPSEDGRVLTIADGWFQLGFFEDNDSLELRLGKDLPAGTGIVAAVGGQLSFDNGDFYLNPGVFNAKTFASPSGNTGAPLAEGWDGCNCYAGEQSKAIPAGTTVMTWKLDESVTGTFTLSTSSNNAASYLMQVGSEALAGSLDNATITNRAAATTTTTPAPTAATPAPTAPATTAATAAAATTTGGGAAPTKAPSGGVALAIIPTFLAAGAAMVASRKKSK